METICRENFVFVLYEFVYALYVVISLNRYTNIGKFRDK